MGFDKFRRRVVGKYRGDFYETINCLKGDLVASEGDGIMYNAINPLAQDLIIEKVVVYLNTQPTATPIVINVGIAATGTPSGGVINIIGGDDSGWLGSPYGISIDADNMVWSKPSGDSILWGSPNYISVTIVSGSPQGLGGSIYVWYRKA